jgi:hypothetical protein
MVCSIRTSRLLVPLLLRKDESHACYGSSWTNKSNLQVTTLQQNSLVHTTLGAQLVNYNPVDAEG